MQQILRYLVFSNTKEKTPFSYKELLANGLDRGVFNSLSTLNKFLGEPRKPSANIEFSECLHIMLKRAFALDLSLLVDWSKTMPLGDPPLSQKSGLTPEESHWVHCLSQLHEHWLPLSRILFVMEADLKAALSVAQAIVLIKDQIALAQSTASQEILASEPGQMEHAFLDWLPGIKRT